MNLSIVIQAGGESRRMGRNKALVPFLGVPLIQRVRDRLTDLGDEVIVTTNQPEPFAFLGLPCFADPVADRGALGGLFTALTFARQPLVAVVACDMPFANPDLLRFACECVKEFDVAIPANSGGLEPLHAIYRRETCLPAVRAALDQGKWRVDSWFDKVRIRVLEPEDYSALDPDRLTFINVNTAEDLALAEDLARKGIARSGCDARRE